MQTMPLCNEYKDNVGVRLAAVHHDWLNSPYEHATPSSHDSYRKRSRPKSTTFYKGFFGRWRVAILGRQDWVPLQQLDRWVSLSCYFRFLRMVEVCNYSMPSCFILAVPSTTQVLCTKDSLLVVSLPHARDQGIFNGPRTSGLICADTVRYAQGCVHLFERRSSHRFPIALGNLLIGRRRPLTIL